MQSSNRQQLQDNTTPKASCSSSCNIGDLSLHLSEIETATAQFHQYGAATTDSMSPSRSYRCCPSYCETFTSFVLKHLLAFVGLSLGTYLGVSSRIGLTKFSQWDGITHFPSFWAQVVGTFIIGVAVAQKDYLQATYGFLYTIITTGVCGSMTTFSSWNVEATKVLLQLNESSLHPIHNSISGGRLVGFMTVLLLGIGMPVSVFHLGRNIGSLVSIKSAKIYDNISGSSNHRTFHDRKPWFFPCASIFIFIVVTISSISVVCFYTEQYEILFSLILGGPGSYMRWCLGSLDQKNIKYIGKFPIGTFLANIIGSLILSVTLVITNYASTVLTVGDIPIAVLSGIAVGFCGSLTTVSTFVSQLCSLTIGSSLCYGLLSIIIAQVIISGVFLCYQLI